MTQNLLNIFNFKNLELLDWQLIAKQIANLAHFQTSKEILMAPISPKFRHEIEFEYDSLDYFLYNMEEIALPARVVTSSIHSDKSNFEIIPLMKKGKIANISELNFLCLLIEGYQELFRDFEHWNKFSFFEIEKKHQSQITSKFVRKLREFVDKSGEVRYENHPELSGLLKRIKAKDKELRTRISTLSKSPLYSNSLQWTEHDIINDHYVLAVRSDSYQANHGSIVARSSSGHTLFVTPVELRDLGNERLQLKALFEEVLDKICQYFSEILHLFWAELEKIKDFLIEIDTGIAKATYSKNMDFVRPTLNQNFEIRIEGIFHPLIEKPVKNDIIIGSTQKGFILSGPNTGGKTVALKAFTLCHLFMHYGLFLPAISASLYPVKNVFYFSNDQQSLADGLSSFAAESKNYLALLTELEDENIIVVDEIFNSTSSEEASALAIELLKEIHARSQSKVIISTHHQFFKTFIHGAHDYISAHVAYDNIENRPLYKIFTGEPGSSMAFTIFDTISKEFEIQTAIPQKAQTLLDNKHVSYEQLLQDLTQKKTSLDKQLIENENLSAELKNQKSSMEGILLLEKQKLLGEYRQKIDGLLKDAKRMLSSIKKGEIATQKSFFKHKGEIDSKLKHTESDLFKKPGVESNSRLYPTPVKFEDIKKGDDLYCVTLDKEVKVINTNPRKGQVRISNKQVTLWIQSVDLRIIPKTMRQNRDKQLPKVNIQKTTRGVIELDGRGMRLDEFQQYVHKSIDELIYGEIPFLIVVHGHGDGILKKWLRTYIDQNSDLDWQAEGGNDGTTRIVLA